MEPVDATVVGSGPNGLAAAIVLAGAGYSVRVIEMRETVGGGARSCELTLPGFCHDVCSAVHPLALSSPLFRTLPLAEHGLSWIHSPTPLAHPLDGDDAVILERSIEATAAGLGPDGDAYRRLIEPFATRWTELAEQILGPPRPPRHPLLLARFALKALQPARLLAERSFRSTRARALFAGCAAHSMASLRRPVTAAFGLFLAAGGHAVGWPVARGGSQAIVDALASYLRTLGGEILVGVPVTCLEELGRSRVVL
ncbi:MAG: phytoene desaturase family protein, partial [Actinomycetota bacterium]